MDERERERESPSVRTRGRLGGLLVERDLTGLVV